MTIIYYINNFNSTAPRFMEDVDTLVDSIEIDVKISNLKLEILADLERKNMLNNKYPTLSRTLKELEANLFKKQDDMFQGCQFRYQVTAEGLFYGKPYKNLFDLDMEILRFLLHGSFKECVLSSTTIDLNLHIIENLEIENVIPFTDRLFAECEEGTTLIVNSKGYTFKDINIKNSLLLRVAVVINECYSPEIHDVSNIMDIMSAETNPSKYCYLLRSTLLKKS